MIKPIIDEPENPPYYKTEDIRLMKVGDNFAIAPYDAGWYFEAPDEKILPIIANTDRIKKYLPGLNFSDEASTKKTLGSLILSTEAGWGFSYILRFQNLPIGAIIVHSPLYNNNDLGQNIRHNIWTIDFFISEIYEGKGIMFQSLCRVLNQLKGMGIPRVYALVDDSNERCLRFVKNIFDEVETINITNKNTNQKPRVFVAEISRINFVNNKSRKAENCIKEQANKILKLWVYLTKRRKRLVPKVWHLVGKKWPLLLKLLKQWLVLMEQCILTRLI